MADVTLGAPAAIQQFSINDPVTNLSWGIRSSTADAMPTQSVLAQNPALWNGAAMDRQRGNIDATLVTLAAATASGNSIDIVNYNGRGLQLGINLTAVAGTLPTLVVTVQGKDLSGTYYTLLASSAISAAGFTLMSVYPGMIAVANAAASTPLPRTFRISYTIGGTAPAFTGAISASVIL